MTSNHLRNRGGGIVDDATRSPTANSKGQPAKTARRPVLARLPDVSSDSRSPQSATPGTAGGTTYRFDPPQAMDSALCSPTAQSAIRNPKSAISSQPHVFERSRLPGPRRIPRRESPILPRSNPFSIPSTRLIDSLAPGLRFVTMVALFTAAGFWFQMMGHRSPPVTRPIPPPQTASRPTVAPTGNVIESAAPGPAPTAAGPLETAPQSGARVGRAGGDNFAKDDQPTDLALPAERPAISPPHFLIASGSRVPRVRTSDPPPATATESAQNDASKHDTEAEESPELARIPGFLIEIPTR